MLPRSCFFEKKLFPKWDAPKMALGKLSKLNSVVPPIGLGRLPQKLSKIISMANMCCFLAATLPLPAGRFVGFFALGVRLWLQSRWLSAPSCFAPARMVRRAKIINILFHQIILDSFSEKESFCKRLRLSVQVAMLVVSALPMLTMRHLFL